MDYGTAHGATANLLSIVSRSDAQQIELTVNRFQHSIGRYLRTDSAGGAMFNIDCRPHGDLIVVAIGLEGVKSGCLHQTNHVGRGVHGRQFRMMSGECVLELDSL